MIDLNTNYAIETSIIQSPNNSTLFVTYRDKCVAKVVFEDDNLDVVIPLIPATEDDKEQMHELIEVRKEVLKKISSRISDIHEILKAQSQ